MPGVCERWFYKNGWRRRGDVQKLEMSCVLSPD